MRIKTLILTSFGRFQDRTIELSDGFNLIYGQNGAGKSTVQHFIEGIFFGFYRPYRKQSSYAAEYEKYRPKNSDRYCGAIILEDNNGKEIRIERDFLKEQDGVTIYDNSTGKDITVQYPYDSITHQNLPLGDMKINSVIYNNTVNIRQLAGRTDEVLADEINARLIELGAGGNENVALERVLAYLKGKKRAIGELNQGEFSGERTDAELQKLRQSLLESERIFDTIQKNQKKMQQYKKKIVMARERIKTAGQQQSSAVAKEIEAIRAKVEQLESKGSELEARLEALRPFAEIDPRMYGRVKILQSNLEGAEERMSNLKEEILGLEGKCSEITGRCDQIRRSLKGLSRYDVQRDYKQYQELLESPMTEEEFWEDQEEVQELVAPSGSVLAMPVIIAAMVIGVFVVGMTLFNPGDVFEGLPWFFTAFVGWLLILGGAGMLWLQRRMPVDEAAAAVDEIFEDEEIEQEMPDVPDAPPTAEAIIKKYGRTTGEEFESFVHKVEGIFVRLEKLTMEESLFLTQLENKRAELKRVEGDAVSFKQDFAEELAAAGVESTEAYGEACEKRTEYEKVLEQLEDNRKAIEEIGEIPEMPVQQVEDNPVLMVASNGEEIHVREAIYAFNEEIRRLREENDHLSTMAVNPVSIRERIETLENIAKRYDRDIKACDKAIGVLEHLNGGTNVGDRTGLEESVGSILKEITGKYDTVAIDDDFKVRVLNPQNGNFMKITALDGETIDRLYFALRFGMGEKLQVSEKMPFVLDDPFVHDELKRKQEAMRFLWTLSQGRQVLLFTAGDDEKRILDSTDLSYNGILL